LSDVVTIGDATLYHGDCLEILPTLPKVDAVITDPPYGLGIEYGTYEDSREALAELAPRWVAAARAMAGRVLCTPGVANIWLYPEPTWTACWAISGAGSRGKWGFSCWQPILCYGQDPYLLAGRGARPDLLFINETADKNGHPCPKPTGFMRRLIDRASIDGVIADPFMGSGTTGVACAQLGRRFIGIEIERKYFDIACERIDNAYRQQRMFA
jgi:site-specific DNA-methyltransferase (adenine-specific)